MTSKIFSYFLQVQGKKKKKQLKIRFDKSSHRTKYNNIIKSHRKRFFFLFEYILMHFSKVAIVNTTPFHCKLSKIIKQFLWNYRILLTREKITIFRKLYAWILLTMANYDYSASDKMVPTKNLEKKDFSFFLIIHFYCSLAVFKRQMNEAKLSKAILKPTFGRKRMKFNGMTTEVKLRRMTLSIFL